MTNDQLAAEPGGLVSTTVSVYNASAVVEEFTFEPLGPCAGFMQIVPDQVSLLPGDESTVEVMFNPPAGRSTEAGALPFGVRAISGVDDYYAAVAEGILNLGAVFDLDTRLVGVTPVHRWVGRYRAEFINNGTALVALDLAMMSEAEDLGFAFAPTQMDLERGESGEAFIKVRPRRPFFMGQPRRHNFQMAYTRYSELNDPADPTVDGTLDGTFEQRPVASRRLLTVAALAVAAVIALVALLPSDVTPASAQVPPQTPQLLSVEPAASDAVLITWEADPTATGYRLDRLLTEGNEQRVVDSASVGGERTAHRFEGLEPATNHCFQLVALNDAGESDPTPAKCGDTLAAVSSEQPTQPPGGASEGGGGGGGQATTPPGTGGGGGGGGQATTPPGTGGGGQATTPPGTGGGQGGTVEPQGAYVVYSSSALDDPGIQNAAQELTQELQAAGQDAQIVDSRQSNTFPDGLDNAGLLVVFQDRFPSLEAARQHCNDPQIQQIVPPPGCLGFAPRSVQPQPQLPQQPAPQQ
jgi:hypothetical protein